MTIALFPSLSFSQNVEERLESLESRLERIETLLLKSPDSNSSPTNVEVNENEIIQVTISNKRFDDGTYEDSIWWDAQYTATGLVKAARAIKGTLVFADLFKEPYFRVKVTIDDPIEPSGVLTTNGIGIGYNQFIESHTWLRTNSLSDMVIWFEVESILYQDGTSVNIE